MGIPKDDELDQAFDAWCTAVAHNAGITAQIQAHEAAVASLRNQLMPEPNDVARAVWDRLRRIAEQAPVEQAEDGAVRLVPGAWTASKVAP